MVVGTNGSKEKSPCLSLGFLDYYCTAVAATNGKKETPAVGLLVEHLTTVLAGEGRGMGESHER